MAKLSPSILSADFARLGAHVEEISRAGCDYVHVDVMDGHFVPNISFGAPVMKSLDSYETAPYDVHLMIEHPERYIEDFVTDKTEFIVVHQETCIHLHRVIQQIKNTGVKAGVSLNPSTPVSSLECILPEIDLVLVMSVNPGFGGQKFIPGALDKIRELDRIRKEKGYNFVIEIDGGVNLNNAREIADAGCDILVAGSAVFKGESPADNVKAFKEIL